MEHFDNINKCLLGVKSQLLVLMANFVLLINGSIDWMNEYVKFETTCMHVSLLWVMLQIKQHK